MATQKKEMKRWHAITFLSLILAPLVIMFVGLFATERCYPADWPGSSAVVAGFAIAFALLAVIVTSDLRKAGGLKELLFCLFMFGGLGMMFGNFTLFALVRMTAHSPRSFEARFALDESGPKGCRREVTFMDAGLDAPVSVCNRDLDLPDASTSGIVRVKELVGPYGVRLTDISVVTSTTAGK
ncbi:hypothetical protein [Burkholderia sp. LMG 32019]|uniref:hypothetical protein n=1 Tax=Burkholderia sp. LMG 32019 TaxID=3158173 RepID=UPI003C307394